MIIPDKKVLIICKLNDVEDLAVKKRMLSEQTIKNWQALLVCPKKLTEQCKSEFKGFDGKRRKEVQ